ncbi:hypothetical protein MMC13_003759 [Lambiella insularis]|nr:hypothetical protein [Lambiella insularis]
MFGVNPKPTNFTSIGENQASYMTTLKDQNLIPSVSFGYTAGNQYRLKTVLGSLTLGGYDSARFSSNNVSFTFAPDDSRDLVVGVQAIKYIDESEHTQDLLDNDAGILAYVDSTIAELWLPESSCKAFEDAFGLVYDTVNQLYPINSTWHSTLKARNPNVTFTLGSEVSGGPTLDIVLPYSAFDLEASWPKYPNNTLYFPLQRAANETQYTLGRTLLQEAYLIVDWERGNFSLSQCVWPDNLGSTIVPIYSPTYGTNSTNSSPQSGSNTTSNNGNNTIAIAVGVALGILVLVSTIAVYLIIRHRKSQNAKRTGPKGKAELDNDGEHPRYEAPGSQTQKSVSESTQLLTLPPPFNDKEILGPHPAFASSAPSITVSELRSEGHTRSPSGSTYHRHEMYGSEFVPIELPASSAQAQELLGSSPEAVHLSDHSSVSSTPLMGALEESNSLIAHSSGASPSKRAQDSSPMNRVASLRGLFNRPGYRRQETMDSIPSLPSRDSPHERGGELFRPISPAGGSAVDAVELQERRDEGRERSNVF